MGLAVYFLVEGQAVGKGRPRVSTIAGRPRLYTPAKTVKWEEQVAAAARAAMGSQEPSGHPMAVSIQIRCQIPQSWSKQRQTAARLGHEMPGKPDLDNVAKAVLDACNGITYRDDKQVIRLTVVKAYDRLPLTEVYMHEVID